MQQFMNTETDFKRDIFNLFSLFFTTAIVVYMLPTLISTSFQILLLIQFYRSKRNYFWLALFFIIEANPGALFATYDPSHTLSLLYSSPFGNLYFWIVFIIIAFFKSLKCKHAYPFFLRTNIQILTFYLLFLLIIFGVYKFPALTRSLLPWLFLFILPRLLRTERDYANFFNLIFSFVFFIFITQFYNLLSGNEFAKLLGGLGNTALKDRSIVDAREALRLVDGILIPFISIIGTTIFLTLRNKLFTKNYLSIILGLSLFSIFLTATRSWLLCVFIIFFGFLFLVSKKPILAISRLILPAILLIIMFSSIPYLSKQAQLAIVRYETIGYLLQGDLTAGGTLKRFDVRSPRVMNKFYESPILGWGYGSEANKFSDRHVGNQNLLLHTGIIGYALFVFFWLNYMMKLYQRTHSISRINPYKKVLQMFIIFLPAIFVIHTSVQWFGHLVAFGAGYTLSILFSFASFAYWKSIIVEKQLKKCNSKHNGTNSVKSMTNGKLVVLKTELIPTKK